MYKISIPSTFPIFVNLTLVWHIFSPWEYNKRVNWQFYGFFYNFFSYALKYFLIRHWSFESLFDEMVNNFHSQHNLMFAYSLQEIKCVIIIALTLTLLYSATKMGQHILTTDDPRLLLNDDDEDDIWCYVLSFALTNSHKYKQIFFFSPFNSCFCLPHA